jgi:hypothetical protein
MKAESSKNKHLSVKPIRPVVRVPDLSPDQLNALCDEYFSTNEKWSIPGLAYHLGFASRQSFYDYEKREAYSYSIKRSRLLVEQYHVEHGQVIDIFALKNMGWTDVQQVQQLAPVVGDADLSKLNDAELETLNRLYAKARGEDKQPPAPVIPHEELYRVIQ